MGKRERMTGDEGDGFYHIVLIDHSEELGFYPPLNVKY